MKVLFQGDSITDAGRTTDIHSVFGDGYASMVKGSLGLDHIGKYEFYNRGINGNRIVDLYARMKQDILNLEPDIMSILIGINDVWREVKPERRDGVDAEKFYRIYSMLIQEVREALPNIKIMILEPFVLKGSETEEHWEYFQTEVPKRAEAAKRIAIEQGLVYVPLQKQFDEVQLFAPAEYWTMDGVHPTTAGFELIKRAWLDAFKKL